MPSKLGPAFMLLDLVLYRVRLFVRIFSLSLSFFLFTGQTVNDARPLCFDEDEEKAGVLEMVGE